MWGVTDVHAQTFLGFVWRLVAFTGLLHGYQQQHVSLDVRTWDSSSLKQPSALWTAKLPPVSPRLRVETPQTADGFMVNMFLYVPPAEM